jgi:NitT/TauT family transport system ATP-binding protein
MLEIAGLSKRFDDLVALTRIDLAVDRGEIVGIVGTSGCGKSTLLRIVGGLEHPSEGRVTLDGVAVEGPRPEVGLVFQEPRLMPWLSVRDNVEFALLKRPRAQRRPLADKALARVGLLGFAEALPQQLSGGMAQRAAIARALLHDPKLILMDEPFGALDALTRERMNLELLNIWKASGKTIVFVTHGIAEAVFLGTRVIVLTAGPARMADNIGIDLPEPRTLDVKTSEAFGEYTRRIYRLLGFS